MSDFNYVIFQAAQRVAAEKQGYINLMKSVSSMRELTTLWNCTTDNDDLISSIADVDLIPTTYPYLSRMPGECGELCKNPNHWTTQVFNFREMTDGKYCIVVPKTRNITVHTGDDENGDPVHVTDDVSMSFVYANTGYDEITETDPGIIPTVLSEYGD